MSTWGFGVYNHVWLKLSYKGIGYSTKGRRNFRTKGQIVKCRLYLPGQFFQNVSVNVGLYTQYTAINCLSSLGMYFGLKCCFLHDAIKQIIVISAYTLEHVKELPISFLYSSNHFLFFPLLINFYPDNSSCGRTIRFSQRTDP